jgi:superfamily I DNA/RNA helicase
MRDVDGVEDDRTGTISVFEGPKPEVVIAVDKADEIDKVAQFIRRVLSPGLSPRDVAIFVRSEAELPRARAAAARAGLVTRSVQDGAQDPEDAALLGTMHLAKGLEFRAVVAMACDEGIVPLASRIAEVADEYELDEVLATERQLLYVAITRARDRAVVSGFTPAS